jgi:Cohesin domain
MVLVRLWQAVILAAALGLVVRGLDRDWPDSAASQATSTIGLLAIDADSNRNNATSLGQLDGCARLEPGSTRDIDYVADAVPQDRPMIGFEVEIRYDPSLLEAVNVDHQLLLAAAGSYSPLTGLSDALPDSDGKLRISVLDTASSSDPQANVETGPGVLARVTFRAKSPGVSKIAIGFEKEPLLYPIVLDTQDELILADRLGTASLAIGQDCPPDVTQPEITDLGPTNEEIIAGDLRPGAPSTSVSATTQASPPLSGGAVGSTAGQTPGRSPTSSAPGSASSSTNADDGSNTWPVVLVGVVALGLAAGGTGWYFYRRSRSLTGGE